MDGQMQRQTAGRVREEREEDGGGPFAEYGGDMPLGGYAALMGAYGAAFGGLLAAAGASGRLPRRVSGEDIVLIGVATHKLARVITKDWVTSPIRAPFTTYSKSLGAGEVSERSRGTGMQRAMGDLLTCPWCIGPWVAGSLVAGLAFAPRTTRAVASTFAAVAISDFLHHAYAMVRRGAD